MNKNTQAVLTNVLLVLLGASVGHLLGSLAAGVAIAAAFLLLIHLTD